MINANFYIAISGRVLSTPRSQKPYYGLRFKNGDEWFNDYIANAGRMTIRETCQMELMFTGMEEKDER